MSVQTDLSKYWESKYNNLHDSSDNLRADKLDLQAQFKESREECDQLKAEVKKKKNRIGILNRSLRRLKKGDK